MQPFPFFSLPVELRSHVLLFALSCGNELHQKEDDEATVKTGLLTANSQFYNEALPIFYRCNTFRIHIYQGYESLPSWVLHPSDHLALIRSVHVHISSWNTSYFLWQSKEGEIPTVLRTLGLCLQLNSLKLTIIHKRLSRKVRRRALQMGASPPNSDPPSVDDIMQVFGGVLGTRHIVVLRDDWLGMASHYRKAIVDAENLKQRIQDQKGTLWNTTSSDRVIKWMDTNSSRSFRRITSLIAELR